MGLGRSNQNGLVVKTDQLVFRSLKTLSTRLLPWTLPLQHFLDWGRKLALRMERFRSVFTAKNLLRSRLQSRLLILHRHHPSKNFRCPNVLFAYCCIRRQVVTVWLSLLVQSVLRSATHVEPRRRHSSVQRRSSPVDSQRTVLPPLIPTRTETCDNEKVLMHLLGTLTLESGIQPSTASMVLEATATR